MALGVVGSNPIFHPKNQKDEGIAKRCLFLYPTGPLQTCLHKGQEVQKGTAAKLSLIFFIFGSAPRRATRECRRPNPIFHPNRARSGEELYKMPEMPKAWELRKESITTCLNRWTKSALEVPRGERLGNAGGQIPSFPYFRQFFLIYLFP